MNAKRNILLSAILAAGICGLVGAHSVTASATDTVFNSIQTQILAVNNENLDNGNVFVMELSATDYMTATEWSNGDFKWLNCEDINTELSNRGDVDLTNNNLCNIPMTENLESYNFEDYIYLDGVSLAEFGQTHAYKLFGNKRTRVNTLSIDFDAGVLQSVSQVTVKEGCLLPTLEYGYLGQGDPSALLVTETAVFTRIEGKWTDFSGYEEETKYVAEDKYFERNYETTYKGHGATPLDGFTDFFTKNQIQGEKIDHLALSSAANTVQGSLMILQLDFPIDATKFNKINLTVYTNYERRLCTYNADSITETSLGEPLEEFSVGGGLYFEISLSTALYANENGEVRTVVFQFVDEGRVEADGSRHHFFFMSFYLSNEPILTKDSFILGETQTAYELTLRFNKTGGASDDMQLDPTKVFVNGVPFSAIETECAEATAAWRVVQGVYQIDVRLPKSYEGAAQIKNADHNFVGNSMGVNKGLVFPNGDVLEKSYAAHIYEGEKILDCELATQFKTVEIQSVGYRYEDTKNLRFTLYFDQEITSSPYYHACERESWREAELTKSDGDLYDSGITQIFVNGGYKSSLLDSIVINGKTIGEWHAHDGNALTNVQIHYGNTALNCVDIIFEAVSHNTYDEIDALVKSGNGITVEVKAGFKFISNKATAKTQTFVLENGAFRQTQAQKEIAVYFNGKPVEQGDTLVLKAPVSEKSLAVDGVEDYQVSTKKNGEYTIYTITYGEGEVFLFQVKGELTSSVPQAIKTGGGCASAVNGISAISTALLLAVIGIVKGGKKHEEN
ncbi:MAG: hypothetical protein IJ308_04755 [Clostridia bacterium]|nr:hypothetical protein [Clostridia bacterium]